MEVRLSRRRGLSAIFGRGAATVYLTTKSATQRFAALRAKGTPAWQLPLRSKPKRLGPLALGKSTPRSLFGGVMAVATLQNFGMVRREIFETPTSL